MVMRQLPGAAVDVYYGDTMASVYYGDTTASVAPSYVTLHSKPCVNTVLAAFL